MADPRISEIRVKGLRTLEDVTLKLGGITVLIGDNGSGKSSLIEACELLRRAASESFAEDVRRIHGGTRSLLRFGADHIELGVRVVWGAEELAYSFSLDDGGMVLSESLVRCGQHEVPLLTRGACSKGPHIEVKPDDPGARNVEAHVRPNDLGLAAFRRTSPHAGIAAVLAALERIDVQLPFDTGPRWAQRSRGLASPLRDAATIEPVDGLSRFGTNLANAFSALKNDFSQAHWQETMDYVRLGLGRDVESINVRADPSGGAIALRLKYAGLDEQVPAFSLSDGMLSYLCFVALYRLNANRSLLAFDEPDLHLHPELLMRVLGFFESMSGDMPVLLATHSDRLLDGLTDPAGSVVLCELDERRATTLVRPDAEDQRGPQKQFALHNLVLACVADELGGDVHQLELHKKLSGRPMKGVGNLLSSCRRDVRRLGPQGQRVFALIDNDRIRDQLRHEGVASTATAEQVIQAIKAPGKCVAPEQLEVLLLEENTETLIKAAAECDGEIPATAVTQALRKDTNARDRILGRVAWAVGRAVRDCMRERVPALERLAQGRGALLTRDRQART